MNGERFDPDLLDEEDPFEIDTQVAHLFKHPYLALMIHAGGGLARDGG